MKQKSIVGIGVAIAMGMMAGQGDAAGFSVQDQSASALGMANAFTAQADDPSAMAYNPAGIAWQPGAGLMLGGIIPYRNASAKVASGVASNQGGEPALTHFYASWMPLDGHWGVGFGVNRPFMMDNQWDSTVFGGQANRTTLKTFRTSADLVFALDSRLALAVGGDWFFATGDMDTITNRFRGSDRAAFGGHGSLLWKFYPGWSLGAIYRFNPALTLSGTNIAAVSSSAHMTVSLPDEARIGLSYDILDNLKFEIDGSWMRWSEMKNLNIVALNTQFNPLRMDNSYGLAAGIRWTWRENSQFRFGYAYDQAASRDIGFSPRIPDANQHRLSLGLGGDAFGAHFDAAFIYSFLQDRTITGGTAFDAVYRDTRYALALSVSTFF